MYAEFLNNSELFEETLKRVVSEWKHSCEHYLTNRSMNRIAWLGQAAMCLHTGVPSRYCSGFGLLTEDQKEKANRIALKYLNIWLENNKRNEASYEEALSIGRQIELY